jgi:hypothetical protein
MFIFVLGEQDTEGLVDFRERDSHVASSAGARGSLARRQLVRGWLAREWLVIRDFDDEVGIIFGGSLSFFNGSLSFFGRYHLVACPFVAVRSP